jgi:thiosulfate/3-mercaptopyruvate sulfurtransferase
MYTTIISPEILLSHLSDPDWAIFDCRFDLKDPNWGLINYQESHIPGAVYAHLDRDLSAPVIPAQTGRHPLPAVEDLAARFSAWGINHQTQVVVYDTAGGAYAARLWWLLRFLGHTAAAVLDGGFQSWQKAGYPLSTGIETHSPSVFTPQPNWDMIATTQEVEQVHSNPHYRLIDARAPERFRGEVEPIDPVAGHISGAVNRFHGANLQPDGKFLPPEVLRSQFSDLINPVLLENTIVYCGSGVTSCHHLVALERAGLPSARLYVGSWSEWITDRKRIKS